MQVLAATLNGLDVECAALHSQQPQAPQIRRRCTSDSDGGCCGSDPNSDHPSCCDVALGERLRKDIYEALRVPVHKSYSESGSWRRVDGAEVMIQQWWRRAATI